MYAHLEITVPVIAEFIFEKKKKNFVYKNDFNGYRTEACTTIKQQSLTQNEKK